MTKQIDNAVIEEQIIDKYGVKGPVKPVPVFHPVVTDPLDDVQIAVQSKKRFMEWWKLHTSQFPVRNIKGVVDAGKIVRMAPEGISVLKSPMIINDHFCEEFPFKMNLVEHFTLEMPELHSLKNCPTECRIGQFGTTFTPMRYMDTLVGTPARAQALTIHTKSVFLSLENSFTHNIENLTINANSFASFDGLTNVEVTQLTLIGRFQKSFKGIHRSIKSNVKVLTISIHKEFDCGVLPFAMLDPSITVIPDVSGNPPSQFTDAMEAVAEGRKAGLNAHDIQELLIDKGLGKYARL